MAASFLDIEAQLGSGFLHPGGQAATRILRDYLAIAPGDSVLEIGCGGGRTTAHIAERTAAEVVALDRSELMLASAKTHVRDRGQEDRVTFCQHDIRQPLPFLDGRFDAAFAESVIALIDPPLVLRECFRVLRPGARMALNERIWKPGVSQETADKTNVISQQAFGIPAATPQPLDHDGWITILAECGFQQIQSMPIRDLPATPETRPAAWSKLDRYWHYLRHPAFIVSRLQFKRAIRRHRDLWDNLETYLFFAEKPLN